jgi:hypothetical protein
MPSTRLVLSNRRSTVQDFALDLKPAESWEPVREWLGKEVRPCPRPSSSNEISKSPEQGTTRRLEGLLKPKEERNIRAALKSRRAGAT